jgi:hypothetical protein
MEYGAVSSKRWRKPAATPLLKQGSQSSVAWVSHEYAMAAAAGMVKQLERR